MRALGVHKLYVLDDQDPFEMPLAQIVAGEAERAGIAVAAHDSIVTSAGSVFTGEVEKIAHSGADAVFLAGGAERRRGRRCGSALHAPTRICCCSASSALVSPSRSPRRSAPAAAQHVPDDAGARRERLPAAGGARARRLPRATSAGGPAPYALYGYEAMSVVLDAIRRAGDRTATIARS